MLHVVRGTVFDALDCESSVVAVGCVLQPLSMPQERYFVHILLRCYFESTRSQQRGRTT